MKLIFTNDIHLNFCDEDKIKIFCSDILYRNPDYIIIAGDISEAPYVSDHLLFLRAHLDAIPMYFVLGNHDYYKGSIEKVRSLMANIYGEKNQFKCHWLPGMENPIALTKDVALIGHDGWYDGGYANWFRSELGMADYDLIHELSHRQCPLSQLRFDAMQNLANDAAQFVVNQLHKAQKMGFKQVYVVTHVAPFPQLSLYRGKISDSTWLPCFSSKKMGDALLKFAIAHPKMHITILCGHTHGEAYYKPLQNLEGYAGEAFYGLPGVAKEIMLNCEGNYENE